MSFEAIPLGQRIPSAVHAVSCSLPTMRDVRGYEEKDPAITRRMSSGYPRFVVHPFIRQLARHLAEAHGLRGRTLWLTSSARMADLLVARLGPGAAARFAEPGSDRVHGVSHPDSPETAAAAKVFLQNIGGFLSSRAAEDELVRRGILPAVEPERTFAGDARAEVLRHLLPSLAPAAARDIFLANSGMNAVHAAFRAISGIQQARGRTLWVQLGWLYLDTIAIVQKFTGQPGDYIYVRDVFDRAGLERLFAEKGSRIAGIVSEVPTNPLIQTPDVAALAALARRHGACLLLDPSISSPCDVRLLPHADVVCSSLTKYTASEGDVIAGLAAVNPAAPHADELRRALAGWLEPVYPRDLARLAAQVGQTAAMLQRVHASVPEVVRFLEGHPAVASVFWALHRDSRDNYLRVASGPDAVGSMVSFSLRIPLERFYDRLRLPKGPSFGMTTTLICPFMYLAHYDLVTTPQGRAELLASGIDPELLRLSVGTEPVSEIIAALAEALA